MSAITLEQIKETQTKLEAMIASFEASKTVEDLFPINIGFPQLKDGEKWVGIIMSANGNKKEHVILMPGEKEDINWNDANKWAESIGGELPDRVESALLFNCLKDEFQEEAYWTRETNISNSEWAWCQYFKDGYQNSHHEYSKLRARAVRRISVI